jgi:hypothetical protein
MESESYGLGIIFHTGWDIVALNSKTNFYWALTCHRSFAIFTVLKAKYH